MCVCVVCDILSSFQKGNLDTIGTSTARVSESQPPATPKQEGIAEGRVTFITQPIVFANVGRVNMGCLLIEGKERSHNTVFGRQRLPLEPTITGPTIS